MNMKIKSLLFATLIISCVTSVFTQDKKIDIASIVLATGTPCGNPLAQSDTYFSTEQDNGVLVVNVIDGNTILIERQDKTQRQFVLGGVDAPAIERKEGKRAQRYLSKLLLKKRVDLSRHGSFDEAQTIGGIVSLKNSAVRANEEMLESGKARFKQSEYLTSFDNCMYEKLSETAKEKGKGVWK